MLGCCALPFPHCTPCGSLISCIPCDHSYRLFGLFPILQWAQSLNDPASAPKDKWLKVIQKAQVWSMLMYYPMEHYCKFSLDD